MGETKLVLLSSITGHGSVCIHPTNSERQSPLTKEGDQCTLFSLYNHYKVRDAETGLSFLFFFCYVPLKMQLRADPPYLEITNWHFLLFTGLMNDIIII